MEPDIISVSLAVAVFLFLVKEVLPLIIPKMRDKTNGYAASLKTIEDKLDNVQGKVESLYQWHNKFDEDGVHIWYIRPSLCKEIHQTRVAVEALRNDFIVAKIREERTIDQLEKISKEEH
jgi:hypothetical protein